MIITFLFELVLKTGNYDLSLGMLKINLENRMDLWEQQKEEE